MSLSSPRLPSPPSLPGLPSHLLQGGLAELQGNVVKLGTTLSAEVAEHIGVPVRLLQQLHLSLNQAEALSEEPLHSYCPSLELSSERWTRGGGSEKADKRKSRDLSPSLGVQKNVCPLRVVKRAASDTASAWAPPATHRKTKVPPAPRPSTSLGLKEIFPTTVGCSATDRGGRRYHVLLVSHIHSPHSSSLPSSASHSPDPPSALTFLQTSPFCAQCAAAAESEDPGARHMAPVPGAAIGVARQVTQS